MKESVREITLQNFEKTVVRSPVPFLLFFWSVEYESCQFLSNSIQKLAVLYRERAAFGSVDVDAQPSLAEQMQLGGLPCVLILHDGRVCAHVGGDLPLSHYRQLLDSILKKTDNKKKRRKLRWF